MFGSARGAYGRPPVGNRGGYGGGGYGGGKILPGGYGADLPGGYGDAPGGYGPAGLVGFLSGVKGQGPYGMPPEERGYGGGGGGGGKGRRKGGGGGYGRSSGGGASSGPEIKGTDNIEGFSANLVEALQAGGVPDEEADFEGLVKKFEGAAWKQSRKFYHDERTQERMSAAKAKAYVEDFAESVMGAFQTVFAEKSWQDKVGWHGVLLSLVLFTLRNSKCFSRVLKTEIIQSIESGILRWSEEERLTRETWNALELAGMSDNAKKKANGHLMNSFADAHFSSPYGTTANDSPDVATLQDFIKGWMSGFAGKAYSQLESGLKDGSPTGQVAALTAIFQHLFDPNVAACPLPLQNCLMPSPWSYIEECAAEVVGDMHNPNK